MKPNLLILLAVCLTLAACAPQAESTPLPTLPQASLQPYQPQSDITASPTPGPSPTPLPSATPAPRTHLLRTSDTLFGLSLFYGVSVDAILAANPGLDRNILPPGKEIIIPEGAGNPAFTPTPQPTPIDLPSGELTCHPTREGAIWCFLPVSNDGEQPLESVSAEIQISAADGSQGASRTAFSPLNLIPPGASLPLAAYFPAPQPANFRATARISAALPLAQGDTRYLAVTLEPPTVEIAPGGRSASVNVRVNLPEGAQASRVWVAAIAYGADGQVLGIRRWELGSKDAPVSGQQTATFFVYSLAGTIEKVEVFAEAQP